MRLCLSQAAVYRIGCVVPPLPIPAEDTAADSGGAEGDSVSVAGSLVYDGDFEGKSKRVVLSHLCIKTFILPRQARDKHREGAQKETRSLKVWTWRCRPNSRSSRVRTMRTNDYELFLKLVLAAKTTLLII